MVTSGKFSENLSLRKKQFKQLRRNLDILLERKAKYGLNVPLELLNQIEDHRTAIDLINQASDGRLSEAELEEELGSLLLAFNQGQVANIMIAKTQPPSREAIAEYLQQMLARILAEQSEAMPEKSEMLQRLWKQPFYVRRYRQVGVSSRPLDDVIQGYLDRERPKGAIREAVMLLADAGVGKTPALSHILTVVADKSKDYFLADKPDHSYKYKLVPLLIPLAELRPDQDLLPLVRVAFNRDATKNIALDEAQALLETYDCLLLLDDLDKMIFTAHSGGIATVRQFMDTNSQVQYVISCRTSTFNYQLGPMDAFVLDTLSDNQVKDVLGNRYDERMSRSFSQLTRNRAMLEIIIKEDKIDDRNWSRGTLLRSMIRYQLGLDKGEQVETEIDLEMLEALLEQMAYQMQCERVNRYSEQQLMEFITEYLKTWHEPYTWREIAYSLRDTGIMIQGDYRQWRFRNRSTHAYFTAAAIARDSTLIKPLLDNVSDFWWREPFEILVGLIDEPSNLLFDILDRDVFVATHCLQFVGHTIDQRIIRALIDAIVEQMRYERAAGRERLVRLLLETGYSLSRDLLWQMLYHEQKSPVIMIIANALANPELDQEDDKFVYNYGAEKIEIDPELEQVINEWQAYLTTQKNEKQAEIEKNLIDFLKSPSEKVGGLAAIALGFIGTDLARKTLLKKFRRPAKSDFVAWCVVEALTQFKQLEVEKATIELYKRQLESYRKQPEQSISQRARAIYLLGSVGGDSQTQPPFFLKLLMTLMPR